LPKKEKTASPNDRANQTPSFREGSMVIKDAKEITEAIEKKCPSRVTVSSILTKGPGFGPKKRNSNYGENQERSVKRTQ